MTKASVVETVNPPGRTRSIQVSLNLLLIMMSPPPVIGPIGVNVVCPKLATQKGCSSQSPDKDKGSDESNDGGYRG